MGAGALGRWRAGVRSGGAGAEGWGCAARFNLTRGTEGSQGGGEQLSAPEHFDRLQDAARHLLCRQRPEQLDGGRRAGQHAPQLGGARRERAALRLAGLRMQHGLALRRAAALEVRGAWREGVGEPMRACMGARIPLASHAGQEHAAVDLHARVHACAPCAHQKLSRAQAGECARQLQGLLKRVRQLGPRQGRCGTAALRLNQQRQQHARWRAQQLPCQAYPLQPRATRVMRRAADAGAAAAAVAAAHAAAWQWRWALGRRCVGGCEPKRIRLPVDARRSRLNPRRRLTAAAGAARRAHAHGRRAGERVRRRPWRAAACAAPGASLPGTRATRQRAGPCVAQACI